MPWPVATQTYGSYQYLLREVGQYLGIGANAAVWEPEQEGTADSIVQRGVKRFYVPDVLSGERKSHEWSFLRPVATLTTVAPYETGTVTIVDGVVTLASGTWPTLAASGDLVVNSAAYSVATRDSATQLTLDDTTVDAAAGTEYELQFPSLALPDDFADLDGPLTFDGSAAWPLSVENVGEQAIRSRRQYGTASGTPTMCGVYPRTTGADDSALQVQSGTQLALEHGTGLGGGTQYSIIFWPTPDAAYRLKCRYRVASAPLSTTNTMPYGGDAHFATVLAACMAEAELWLAGRGKLGGQMVHRANYLDRLRSSVSHDRRVSSPDRLGYNGDNSDRPMGDWTQDWRRLDQIVTYNGA